MDPFITAQEVVDWIGRGEDTDPGIVSAVEDACDICRGIAEQSFNEVLSDTVFLDGPGTDALLLPELPVTAVSLVTVGTESVEDFSINGNGILFRGSPGCDPRPVWPMGRQNIEVTYDHGYADGDVPQRARRVALAIASRLVIQGAALEEAVGDVRVKYGVNATDLTENELRILKSFRQIR